VFIPNDAADDVMLQAALADEKIKKIVEGKEIVRTITVKNKLINLIVR
jgi:leucyl-tRNA synthetase